MNWTLEYMRVLLTSLRRHECLWNVSCPDFKLRNVKLRAYNSIAEEIRSVVSVEDAPLVTFLEIKNKISNIRIAYRRERRKVENSERDGAGVEDVYRPGLYWYTQADAFLRRPSQARSSASNLRVN